MTRERERQRDRERDGSYVKTQMSVVEKPIFSSVLFSFKFM